MITPPKPVDRSPRIRAGPGSWHHSLHHDWGGSHTYDGHVSSTQTSDFFYLRVVVENNSGGFVHFDDTLICNANCDDKTVGRASFPSGHLHNIFGWFCGVDYHGSGTDHWLPDDGVWLAACAHGSDLRTTRSRRCHRLNRDAVSYY